MAATYIVEQASSQSGPWTAVSGSPFVGLTDTVTGLLPGATYFFRITGSGCRFWHKGYSDCLRPHHNAYRRGR